MSLVNDLKLQRYQVLRILWFNNSNSHAAYITIIYSIYGSGGGSELEFSITTVRSQKR